MLDEHEAIERQCEEIRANGRRTRAIIGVITAVVIGVCMWLVFG